MRLETDYPDDDPRTGTRVRYADGTAFGSPHASPAHASVVDAAEALYSFDEDSVEALRDCTRLVPRAAEDRPMPRAAEDRPMSRAAEAALPMRLPMLNAEVAAPRAKDGASKFQLSLAHDVPGAPRTETLIFATGRGAPVIPANEIRDTALRVLRDGVSMEPETVIGLCNALLELDARLSHKSEQLEIALLQLSQARDATEAALLQLSQARDATEAYVLDLQAARTVSLQAEVLREAALEDALQQRILAIQLSEDNRTLRLAARPSAESSAYLDLQVLIDDEQCPVADSALDAQWDEDDHTVVQDPPYV